MGILKHTDKYNWEAIGSRIKNERKAANLTQSELMSKIGRAAESYRLLGRWERGIARPDFGDMIELCKVFDCDIGYLLCEPEYVCRDRRITDIHKATGLSADAATALCEAGQRKGLSVPGFGSIFNHDDVKLMNILEILLNRDKENKLTRALHRVLVENDAGVHEKQIRELIEAEKRHKKAFERFSDVEYERLCKQRIEGAIELDNTVKEIQLAKVCSKLRDEMNKEANDNGKEN